MTLIPDHRKLLFLLILTSLVCGCSVSTSDAYINNARLYMDLTGNQQTTTYDWLDVFYCVVHISDSTPETIIKASWIAVDTDRAEPNLVIKIEEKSASNSPVIFHLKNEGNFWPLGSYKLFLYLDGKLDQTIDFNVEAGELP